MKMPQFPSLDAKEKSFIWGMIVWIVCVAVMLFTLGCILRDSKTHSRYYENVKIYDCSGDKFKPEDGDTFYCNKKAVRIAGIDTPEIQHPQHGIFEDQEYGPEAAAYATKIFQNAKTITALVFKTDKYGRDLAYVLVDGELFAPKMIEAGFAYETVSVYGDQGFAGYAALIMKAWDETQYRPEFQNPHDWRKEHQKKD